MEVHVHVLIQAYLGYCVTPSNYGIWKVFSETENAGYAADDIRSPLLQM
jgi:hypothetical protein